MRRMSAFLTKSCQRMSRILRRHLWSTASIRCISALLIAQQSDPQSIVGSMKTLYRRSLVLFITRDVHKCRSRICIADRAMALRLHISGSLLQDEWIIILGRQVIPHVGHRVHRRKDLKARLWQNPAVADPGGVQTPALLFSCPFLKRTYFENMSLRFLAEQGASRTRSKNYRNLVRNLI